MKQHDKIITNLIKSIDRKIGMVDAEQQRYVSQRQYSLASACDARVAGLYDARAILREEMFRG